MNIHIILTGKKIIFSYVENVLKKLIAHDYNLLTS